MMYAHQGALGSESLGIMSRGYQEKHSPIHVFIRFENLLYGEQ